jgi:hypothetical protein
MKSLTRPLDPMGLEVFRHRVKAPGSRAGRQGGGCGQAGWALRHKANEVD